MSIIRAPRPESNFYLLDKQIIEDGRLTWAARGLLVYLLGKPDHWQVSVAHLRKETAGSSKPTGRDGVYSLLEELIKAGYIIREQARRDDGKLGETNYIVSERPLTDSPLPAQPDTAQPYTANPTQVSIEDKQELNEVRTEGRKAPSGKFDPMQFKPENVSQEAWGDWIQHRKEIRKPLTATSCKQQVKALSGTTDADAVIRMSIANGWTGLFPERNSGAGHQKQSRHHGLDEIDYGGGSSDTVIIGGF